MAKVPAGPGAMKPMSRALRPGVQDRSGAASKKPAFDLGMAKASKTPAMPKMANTPAATKPPAFKRPTPRR